MLCLQLGTVVGSTVVVFVSGMLANSIFLRWWLRRERTKTKS